MAMTHYMEWLSMNQPWNLILFMLVPMALAETILASEIFLQWCRGGGSAAWRRAGSVLAVVLGAYFTVLSAYWYLAYVGTIASWRGAADALSVWLFLAAVIPSLWLVFSGLSSRFGAVQTRGGFLRRVLALFLFVLLTHLAMVFGMLSPSDDGTGGAMQHGAAPHAGHVMQMDGMQMDGMDGMHADGMHMDGMHMDGMHADGMHMEMAHGDGCEE